MNDRVSSKRLNTRLRSPDHSPISDDTRSILCAERERTGIGLVALLKRQTEVPEGLSANRASQWLNGSSKQAPLAHIDFLMTCWRALPDAAWVEITEAERSALIEAMGSRGINPRMLLSTGGDIPEGLSIGVLNGILSGKTKRVRIKHREFLSPLMARA